MLSSIDDIDQYQSKLFKMFNNLQQYIVKQKLRLIQLNSATSLCVYEKLIIRKFQLV